MPKITLPDGTIYNYKTIPLFPGVKRIDKEKAAENLRLLKNILDRNGIDFSLAAGTVLGAIREGDFITHDEDIDIAMAEERREDFLSLLLELRKNGFDICRFDRRDLYSLMRNGEYIDIYFFRPYLEEYMICSGWVVKKEFTQDLRPILFRGEEYLIPASTERYFIEEYGDDWRTPIQWNNFGQSRLKILLFNLKEHVKALLPKRVYDRMVVGPENRMIEKSLRHIRRLDEYDRQMKRNSDGKPSADKK